MITSQHGRTGHRRTVARHQSCVQAGFLESQCILLASGVPGLSAAHRHPAVKGLCEPHF